MSDPTDGLLRRRVRLGGAGLIVSGLLLLTTPFLVVGTITPPDEIRVITETSAVNANTFEWRLGIAIAFVANAALVLGLFALYIHLAHKRCCYLRVDWKPRITRQNGIWANVTSSSSSGVIPD